MYSLALLRTPLFFYASFLLVSSFLFHSPSTTEIYTLSLHDALPISSPQSGRCDDRHDSGPSEGGVPLRCVRDRRGQPRSEEHTSELQSLTNLVCRLLLEKKKQIKQKKNQSQTKQTDTECLADVSITM